MPRSELMQRKPAIGGFDEKVRSFQSDLGAFNSRVRVS
jgi:hypothetical protein